MTRTDKHRREGPSVEIERKYLLRSMPALPPSRVVEIWRIEQGYLDPQTADERDRAGGLVTGRLRRITHESGEVTCHHTMKRGVGLVREEIERSISADQFDRAWQRTAGCRLRKSRHRVREGTAVWEIDVIDKGDLVLAEIELPSADAPVSMPAWLAPVVVREVTDDAYYTNAAIARRLSHRSTPSANRTNP